MAKDWRRRIPAANPTPLIQDLDGDGEKEILVVRDGTRLLDCRRENAVGTIRFQLRGPRSATSMGTDIWTSMSAAWTPLNDSIGTTIQSYCAGRS